MAGLIERGVEVLIEAGAGTRAGFDDDAYRAAGARVVDRAEAGGAEVVAGIRSTNASGPIAGHPQPAPTARAVHIALFDPLWDPAGAERLAEAGVSALSLDLVPRITRAQTMDVLSSMATVAGYEAVLLAARRLPKVFPLLMTAAGTLSPARVLVLGAGVAGLQAIATARRLGAVVEAYDIRPAAVEQIRSLGARPVELTTGTADTGTAGAGPEGQGGYARAQSDDEQRRQRDRLTPHVAGADVVITTAAVPGRRSPLLLTTPMIEAMGPGSVVVDLAAERGGNTDATVADGEVQVGGATVLGPTDLASAAPVHASQMFATNLTALLDHLLTRAADRPDGSEAPGLWLDLDDEITAAMLVTHNGAVVHPQAREQLDGSGPGPDRAPELKGGG